MRAEDLHKRIEKIDQEMTAEGVPIPARPLKALLRIFQQDGILADPLASPLLDEIQDWYTRWYGDHTLINFTIGQKPIILRGLLYFVRFPTVYGTARLDTLQFVEGLTHEMAQSLTHGEREAISGAFLEAYHQFVSLENLRRNPSFLVLLARQLVERGLQDISASVSLLKAEEDFQGSVFHAQQAAEKFTKAALAQHGASQGDLKKFGHDLAKVLAALESKQKKFNHLQSAVVKLNLPDMSIRYLDRGVTTVTAVEAVACALHICSFISNQWQLDEDRQGAEPTLEPGKFYRNSLGINFRCMSIKKDTEGHDVARMAMLDNLGIDAILRQKCEYAYLYAEITDPEEIKRLDHRYRTVILGEGRSGS